MAGLSLQSTRIMALTYSSEDPAQAPDMHSAKPASGLSGKDVSAVGDNSGGCIGGSGGRSVGSSDAVDSVGGSLGSCDPNPDHHFLQNYSIDATGISITITQNNHTDIETGAHRELVSHTEPNSTVHILPRLVELVLPPRSLYILRGPWRYNYNHAILGLAQVPHLVSPLPGPPTQRSSVIFRDVKM